MSRSTFPLLCHSQDPVNHGSMPWFLSPSPFPWQPGSTPSSPGFHQVPCSPPLGQHSFSSGTGTEGTEQVYRKHMAVDFSQNSPGHPSQSPFPRAGTGSWADRLAGRVRAHGFFGKYLDKGRKSSGTPSSCGQTHWLTELPRMPRRHVGLDLSIVL